MNTELVRAIFDCGVDDLSLLDDAECDMFKVVKEMRNEGIELTMNNIIEEVFSTGKLVIVDAFEAKFHGFLEESQAEDGIETKEKLNQLNPDSDFTWWINLQDTHFCGDSRVEAIYKELFPEELEECERLTGYPIEW